MQGSQPHHYGFAFLGQWAAPDANRVLYGDLNAIGEICRMDKGHMSKDFVASGE